MRIRSIMAAVILLAGVVRAAPVVSDHAAKSYTVYNGSTATARMTQTGDLQGSGSLKLNGTTRINSSGVGTFASGTTINGGTAWHSGNDGSGSGLDADLFDGFGSDDFATTASDALKLPIANPTFTGTLTGPTGTFTSLNVGAYNLVADFATTGSLGNYLPIAGGTLTGTLNGPTINATTALQTGGVTRINASGVGTLAAGSTVGAYTVDQDFATTASDAAKLPLAGGASFPITGDLYLSPGSGIGTIIGTDAVHLTADGAPGGFSVDYLGVAFADEKLSAPLLTARVPIMGDPDTNGITGTNSGGNAPVFSAILGGTGNVVDATGAVTGGGASYCTIAGGNGNLIEDAVAGNIAGGSGNTIGLNGQYGAIIGGLNNTVTGYASSAAGLSSTASGYAAHCYSDNATVSALTGFIGGGGHNQVINKGSNVAPQPNSGETGADSAVLGSAYSIVWALRSTITAAFDGRVNGDYSFATGMLPRVSDAHDGAFVHNGVTNGDTSTNTTGVNQAIFFGKGIESGGQMAIKGQPLTTATLTVHGPTAVQGTLSTTGTVQAASIVSKGAVWKDMAASSWPNNTSGTDWSYDTTGESILCATAGGRVIIPITYQPGSVVTRLRARWAQDAGTISHGITLALLSRSATSTASATWTTISTANYTSADFDIHADTLNVTDTTLAEGTSYAIEVTALLPVEGNVFLYDVGIETNLRVY